MTATGLNLSSHIVAIAEMLADCVCERVNANQPTCFCGVMPGDEVPLDYTGCGSGECENGMAWVRITGMYPATSIGQANFQPSNCGMSTGVDFELGVVRCAPMPDNDGTPPSGEVMMEAMALQMADAAALRAAVLCCTALIPKDTIVGGWLPVGPQGAILGGRMILSTIINF